MIYDQNNEAQIMFRAAEHFANRGNPSASAQAVYLHEDCQIFLASSWANGGDRDWISAILSQLSGDTQAKIAEITRDICTSRGLQLPDSLAQIEMPL
jgi:hypothetical protein